MKLKNVKPGMYFKFNIPHIDGAYIAMATELDYTGPLDPTSIQMVVVSVGDPQCRIFEMGEVFDEYNLTGYTRMKRPKFKITHHPAVMDKLKVGDFIYNNPINDDEEIIGMVVWNFGTAVDIMVLDTSNPKFAVGETFSVRQLDNFLRVEKPKWKIK